MDEKRFDPAERKPRVLVVDDNEVLRTVLMITLRAEGYECSGAANGAEALALFESAPTEAVLLDLQMPVMGGAEFLRVLRARHDLPQPFVLVMSASGYGAREEAFGAGADSYLDKPFQAARIHEELLKSAA